MLALFLISQMQVVKQVVRQVGNERWQYDAEFYLLCRLGKCEHKGLA
ncbi:MAG: hypothetical protein RIQ89_1823 [Bacteroidota bacterium]|jgi:hypothetical protein